MFDVLGEGYCPGKSLDLQECVLRECDPINGQWGEWQPVTSCGTTCGPKRSNMTRHCDSPPAQHGGKECTGITYKEQLCENANCNNELADVRNCSAWTDWSDCSTTCGEGISARSRKCKDFKSSNSTISTDELEIQKKRCQNQDCEGSISKKYQTLAKVH